MTSVSIPGSLWASEGHDPAFSAGEAQAERAGSGAEPGLVICAKTPRALPVDVLAASDLRFPGTDLLDSAAALYTARPAWDGHEGPRPRLTIAPGLVAVSRPDLARRERTLERQAKATQVRQDTLAAYLLEHGELPAEQPSSREVTVWSRKSRANMVRALCELDYSPLIGGPVLAMVTLTYPGEWETVAPTGQAVKRHLEAFKSRFLRHWGRPVVGVWKLELQRRGAPHFHILMAPPQGAARNGMTWKAWLSWVWPDIVAHPDPVQRMRHEGAGTNTSWAEGLRCRDPKRVAVYFTKHGTFRAKEYQHVVPPAWQAPGCGPGRFWGYWGLARETRAVEIDDRDAVLVARTLRRWARAQGTTRAVQVWRRDRPLSPGVEGPPRPGGQRRNLRRRVRRLGSPQGTGWVSVNDGSAMASQLSRYLDQLPPPTPAQRKVSGWAPKIPYSGGGHCQN